MQQTLTNLSVFDLINAIYYKCMQIIIKTVMLKTRLWIAIFTVLVVIPSVQALELAVYNPGKKSALPVSSTLIIGQQKVMLVDAQLQRNDAHALVKMIQATGKELSTVYISHRDPDYYFGLQIIQQAFPKAHIVATQATTKAIKTQHHDALSDWQPLLKDNAPTQIIVPTPLPDNTLHFEEHQFEIHGVDPQRTFLWIPAARAIIGGAIVSANAHISMADTPTRFSRREWVKTLDLIQALNPEIVIPGHYLSDQVPAVNDSVAFTRRYIQYFEINAGKFKSSVALIKAMQQRFPNLPGHDTLSLSAQIVKGN
jgi:glyoxylase-like metal-dependent hydrolase (beta-lactamase superfamily II)